LPFPTIPVPALLTFVRVLVQVLRYLYIYWSINCQQLILWCSCKSTHLQCWLYSHSKVTDSQFLIGYTVKYNSWWEYKGCFSLHQHYQWINYNCCNGNSRQKWGTSRRRLKTRPCVFFLKYKYKLLFGAPWIREKKGIASMIMSIIFVVKQLQQHRLLNFSICSLVMTQFPCVIHKFPCRII
jgi:hypothetical protein